MNLTNISKIYFIGIGGVGMSAAAGIAKEAGFEVQGSDSKEIYDPAKSVLDNNDIEYTIGYDKENIKTSDAEIFIASAGESESNPEVAYLKDQNIPIYSLSELLYEIAKDNLRIVIAGTHGKSTTTGIFGTVVKQIDNSSFMTGAILLQTSANYHYGTGHYFIFEGDEYKALYDDPTPKFQQYKPDIVVLTNLEFDHPDLFENMEAMTAEFRQMLENMPNDGLVVYNSDSADLEKLIHPFAFGHVSFGIKHAADFQARDIVTDNNGTSFKVIWTKDGEVHATEDYQLQIFGEINVYNALGVIATLRPLGFSRDDIQSGFNLFTGLKRRMEFIGEKNGVKIFDDYAHHPTAVRETLLAARKRFPDSRIWAIFEPHTFSRTVATLDDLSKSFMPANKVLLSEIYPAREQQQDFSINGQQVVEEINKHHSDARLVASKSQALEILENELHSGDVVIIMAVGSFNQLSKELLEKLS